MATAEHDTYRLWEVIGTWLSGVGAFAAVIVSLVLSRAGGRPRLRLLADKRIFISGVPTGTPSIRPGDFPDVLWISVDNVGMTVVRITGVYWRVRIPILLRWLFAEPEWPVLSQNPPAVGERSHDFPTVLQPSETMQWLLDYEHITDRISKDLLAMWPWRLRLRFLRVWVNTSVGRNVGGKIGPTMRATLAEKAKKAYEATLPGS
jgi:hypothetical protein